MEELEEGKLRPTWKLAWGLWWRFLLISLGVYGIVLAIIWGLVGSMIGGLFQMFA